ncbi:MAG: hypothetical protein WBQ57_01785, partial [Rhodanobacteraceae bacterium]
CFLPDLAGFAGYRRERTDGAAIDIGEPIAVIGALSKRRPSGTVRVDAPRASLPDRPMSFIAGSHRKEFETALPSPRGIQMPV